MTLQNVDTVIAFAAVMLGVSLLITILTQMVSALFGLRGTNLLWGLKALFESVDPRLTAQAEAVLRHPLISDSVFSRFQGVGPVGWLLKRWTLASAVRPDELVRTLSRISADLKTKDPTTANLIDSLLADSDPEAVRKVKMLSDAFRSLNPGYALQIDKMLQQLWETSRQSLGRLEALFNTVMDRVSQRFALQMRLWTVLFAVLVAFVTHLDSFRLLEQLSSNPEMRASLLSSSEALMKQAEAMAKAPGGEEKTVAELRDLAQGIRARLESSGWRLIPSPYPGFNYQGKRHLLGILISAAFLTLGAPFWFNCLKALANLRPVLAGRQAKGEAAAG